MNQFLQLILSENINQFLNKIEVKNIAFTQLNELLFEKSGIVDFFNDIVLHYVEYCRDIFFCPVMCFVVSVVCCVLYAVCCVMCVVCCVQWN